jgi:tRNA-dihydrouridine synthase B
VEHLHDHYSLYGQYTGVRSARKHIGWYVQALPGGEAFRRAMLVLDDSSAQVAAVEQFFDTLSAQMDRIPPPARTTTPTIHTGEMV